MLRYIVLLFAITIYVAQCIQIHDYLTKQEMWDIFKTTHKSVPEYDVIPIHHTFTDNQIPTSPGMVKLRPFGNDLELYLHPTEGILAGKDMPIWTAKSEPSAPFGVEYKRMSNVTVNSVIFEDLKNLATLLLSKDRDGFILMDGIINDDLIICPLPNRVINIIRKSLNSPLKQLNTSNTNTPIKNYLLTHYHVVYKKKPAVNKKYFKKKYGEGYRVMQEYTKSFSRLERDVSNVPKIAYPEILIVVEHQEFLNINRNYTGIVAYVLSYWHAVDLRFRRLENPAIRLNIAGIIIAQDFNATSYIAKNRVNEKNVDIDTAIYQKGIYFKNEKRFRFIKDYDIVVTMTSFDLCSFEENIITHKKTNYCNSDALGMSYSSGACVIYDDHGPETDYIESVAIVEDNGHFSSIIPTAHEIGHLFGASHDDNKNECHNGYIMSSSYHVSPNNFIWSNCSLEEFYNYFRGPRAHCLFNEPKKQEEYPRILPGKLFSLEEQCKRAFKSEPCYYDERVCIRLECRVPGLYNQCQFLSAAAEGSSCGTRKICLDGKCVDDITNNTNYVNIHVNENTSYYEYNYDNNVPRTA